MNQSILTLANLHKNESYQIHLENLNLELFHQQCLLLSEDILIRKALFNPILHIKLAFLLIMLLS